MRSTYLLFQRNLRPLALLQNFLLVFNLRSVIQCTEVRTKTFEQVFGLVILQPVNSVRRFFLLYAFQIVKVRDVKNVYMLLICSSF